MARGDPVMIYDRLRLRKTSTNDKNAGRDAGTTIIHILLLALLSACTVGPNYFRPWLNVPAAYKSAAATEKAPPRLGRDWWHLFGDPELDTMMEELLRANLDIMASVARVAEAREALVAVRSQFYPVVTVNPEVTRSRFPAGVRASSGGFSTGTGGITPTPTPAASPLASATPTPRPAGSVSAPTVSRNTIYQLPFDLTYEIDIWGRVRRAVEASEAQLKVSLYDREVVRQTMLADLAQNYFNLRSVEAQEEILTRNVALYREQLELTQLQFRAGLTNETNIWQTTTLLESTHARMIDLRRQRADLEHAIAILLGRPPAEFSLKVNTRRPQAPQIPTGVPADLLRRRPDVAQAEQNLVAASAQIGVAQANLYPAVRLSASAGLEGTTLNQVTCWSNHFWTLGGTVAAPLFEGGRLRANLRQAWARYQELEATYRGVVLGAFRDVEDSLNDLHLRAEEAQAQARAVAAARQYLELTQTQYRTGLINYLQVIDADRTLLTNEIAQTQVVYQRMISAVLLIKALGGGWDALPPA